MPCAGEFQVSSKQGWIPSQKIGRGCRNTSWPVLITAWTSGNIDAAAAGAFLDLTIAKAKELVEKMVSNQGWSDERLQPCMKGMHTVKETDMITTKLDLLIKKMEEGSKQPIHASVYAMGSHFTCEVCGNDGHSGNGCPETREDCAYRDNNNNNNNNNNNGYRS